MGLVPPKSMNELLYFTNRKSDAGTTKAWVYKKECPQCHKAKMGKPVDKGKVKIRSTEYVCPECGYTEEKVEHEESCEVQIQYTCPECKHVGEATSQYKRKTWKGVKAYVFECGGCGEKLGVTKKMAEKKK